MSRQPNLIQQISRTYLRGLSLTSDAWGIGAQRDRGQTMSSSWACKGFGGVPLGLATGNAQRCGNAADLEEVVAHTFGLKLRAPLISSRSWAQGA